MSRTVPDQWLSLCWMLKARPHNVDSLLQVILMQPGPEAEPLKGESSQESDWELIKMQILGQEVWGGA